MSLDCFPNPPAEAWKYWQDKVPMSKKVFNSLAEDDRVKAFIVGGMAKADMLNAMYDSIGEALETGKPMEKWKEEIQDLFQRKGWTSPAPFRLDNIFRTNIQTAYQVGRYKQMMDVVEDRPYWQYSAVNDSRTRENHAALHGRVVKAKDPFWDTFYPPNGFRCRCSVKTLSERQMKKKGLKTEKIEPGSLLKIPMGRRKGAAINVMPDKNFNTNPAKSYWKADLSRYRSDVKQSLLRELTHACPDDFCTLSDYEQGACYKRLKRHLIPSDLEDLQTVVWAEKAKVQKGFGEWLDTIDTHRPKGELYPVGNLPGKVLRHLEKKGISPRLSLITLEDHQIAHMLRSVKANRNAALTIDEIKTLPEQLATGKWWYDNKNKNCLVTWVRQKEVWLKMAIQLDYKIHNKKALVANSIRTAGVVKKQDVMGVEKYEEI